MLFNILLLVISIVIYLSFGISNFIFILFSILTTFIAAKFLEKKSKKIILAVTIAVNALILIFLKLYGANVFPSLEGLNIIAPVGVSYYTLQVISYLIDVYKGKYKAENNFLYYCLYIMYIPHLFIGPISRYDDMKEQFLAPKKFSINSLYNGGLRIVWGLIKKLVISGRVAIVISTISQDMQAYQGAYAFLAMILYSIQLYTDFSGGIDIVMGVSKMLGIELQENFDSPYYSQTIKEFWRRWHISLSSWLRDYVYIPLGGSRCSKLRKCFNTIVTFLVSGFWHGANYLLWGVIHGIFVLLGDKIKTKFKWLNRLITFLIVSFLWSFFIWPTTGDALRMMGSVFTTFNISDLCANFLNLGLSIADWIVLGIFTIGLFIFDGNKNKIIQKVKTLSPEIKTIILCVGILLIFVFGIYGIGFNVNEFIYSKF